jgi:hypothetical protein
LVKHRKGKLSRKHSLITNQIKSGPDWESPVKNMLHCIPTWLGESYLTWYRCSVNNCKTKVWKQEGWMQSYVAAVPFSKAHICVVKTFIIISALGGTYLISKYSIYWLLTIDRQKKLSFGPLKPLTCMNFRNNWVVAQPGNTETLLPVRFQR